MMIIGCDYHPGFQQIALLDTETARNCESGAGVSGRKRKRFTAISGRTGVGCGGDEASGQARWFERLLSELQFERGSGMPPRSARSEYASRRRIARMRS